MVEHRAPGVVKIRPLLTLETKLRDIPSEWLLNVAPYVMLKGFQPCWIWAGPLTDKGYPVFRPVDPDTGKQRKVYVRPMIAKMFWEYQKGIHVHNVCNTLNCVNPSHMYLVYGYKHG
jgi:hypothetical protein